MRELLNESRSVGAHPEANLLARVERVEQQAGLLLTAMHAIYIALASFASATLVTLLGAGLSTIAGGWPAIILATIGVLLGAAGVGGLVHGCVNLFRATQISLVNIREEARLIRTRHERGAGTGN